MVFVNKTMFRCLFCPSFLVVFFGEVFLRKFRKYRAYRPLLCSVAKFLSRKPGKHECVCIDEASKVR